MCQWNFLPYFSSTSALTSVVQDWLTRRRKYSLCYLLPCTEDLWCCVTLTYYTLAHYRVYRDKILSGNSIKFMQAHGRISLWTVNLYSIWYYRILWSISACTYSGKRNDSMHLIKDTHLYGTQLCSQTFGHVMDAGSSALVFTAAAQDDECWWLVWRLNLLVWQLASFVAIISQKISGLPHTFQPVVEVKLQNVTPIKRMCLIDNGLWREESMCLINNVCLIVWCA